MANGEERESSEFEVAKAEARKKYEGLELKALCKQYIVARDAKAKLEERLSVANAHFDVLRFECIPTTMDKQGVETVAFEGIGRVSLTGDMFVSMKPGAKEPLFAWFKKNKLGDLIQPAINSSTLKAWVKERLKKGKTIPSDYLNVSPVTRASVTKVSG